MSAISVGGSVGQTGDYAIHVLSPYQHTTEIRIGLCTQCGAVRKMALCTLWGRSRVSVDRRRAGCRAPTSRLTTSISFIPLTPPVEVAHVAAQNVDRTKSCHCVHRARSQRGRSDAQIERRDAYDHGLLALVAFLSTSRVCDSEFI